MKKSLVLVFTALAVSVTAASIGAQGTATAAQGAAAPTQAESPKPAAPTGPVKSQIIQKIIVKVNGEIFTQSDLESRQIMALRDQQRMVQKASDLSTDPALAAALTAVTPPLLIEAVDELMLVQHGKEIGTKFSDVIFKDSIEQLKKMNKIPDDATFQAVLKQEGMSMADLRQNIERSFYKGEAERRELARNMTLTEDEARAYYNTHTDQFIKPATVTLREIAIDVPTDKVSGQVSFSVSNDETIKKKITAIRERALKGEDFAKLAAEASESASKDNGGLIGTVEIVALSATLAEQLEKMKPGDITEPIRNKTGYQIIKLDARSVAEPEKFEKSREQITQRILESRLDVERAKLLDKLRLQAVIEWKDETFKKMYEAARAAQQKPAANKDK